MMNEHDYHHHDQSKMTLYDKLSSLVMDIMRSPPTSLDLIGGDGSAAAVLRRTWPSFHRMTPVGFASLLVGMSLSLMLCGSATFLIGFLLIPWVLGLLMFLYVVRIVASVSTIGKAVNFSHGAAVPPPYSPRKDLPAWEAL